jgi:hypothetical protein
MLLAAVRLHKPGRTKSVFGFGLRKIDIQKTGSNRLRIKDNSTFRVAIEPRECRFSSAWMSSIAFLPRFGLKNEKSEIGADFCQGGRGLIAYRSMDAACMGSS